MNYQEDSHVSWHIHFYVLFNRTLMLSEEKLKLFLQIYMLLWQNDCRTVGTIVTLQTYSSLFNVLVSGDNTDITHFTSLSFNYLMYQFESPKYVIVKM
jgi:hypothetical protein